jgi:serine protease Do
MKRVLTVSVLCLVAGAAHALPPEQIYARAAELTWQVRALGADEKLLAAASGIAVAPGKVLTSCQVLARARQLQLRRANSIYDARLEAPDVERDLCLLDAPGLASPAPVMGSARSLRPGQRLYAIGFGVGNAASINEGLVSVVHDAGDASERIQTTIPAARGLLGAGVYDEEARLIGVITASPKEAATVAFAVPADWVPEVAARGQAALAARSKPAAATPGAVAAAPGMPAAGTTWVYGYIERIFGRKQVEYSVRVLRVIDAVVEEALTFAGSGSKDARRVVDAREARFLEQRLDANATLIELAPYLVAASNGKEPAAPLRPMGYPIGDATLSDWLTSARLLDWEQVTVPAGTFRALRVEIDGKRERPPFTNHVVAGSFRLTAWYAPEVQRLVRLEHQVRGGSISGSGGLVAHDVVELLKYSPGS